ncbi:MAG: radical SAM protein [Thermodesulfovibrionales bacterium]
MNKILMQKIDKRLSLEKGTIFKEHGGKVRIVLIYPNRYRIGMSNLGFQGIYGLLNSIPHVVCERAFLPDDEDFLEHQRTRIPIISYETKTPIQEFDIVAFSISFELDYINIVRILSLSNIPLLNKDRKHNTPLLIAGGVCCSSNPEPFADFFDVIFIGEGEDLIIKFIDIFIEEDRQKERIQKRCHYIDGIYVPRHYNVDYEGFRLVGRKNTIDDGYASIKKVSFDDFCNKPLTTVITTTESEFSNMHLIEVMRGCHWQCRFCLVGTLYSPVRIRGIDVLKDSLFGLKDTGLRIGLIAPSITDYNHLKTLLSFDGVCPSITSIRANNKAIQVIDSLKGLRSISIAPETGNERLRGVINKKIRDDDILSVSEYIFKKGFETLRLYFMIGLPTETEGDIADIISLISKIRAFSKKALLSITISIFIPKPFTPFQWHSLATRHEIKTKMSYIEGSIKTLPRITLRKEGIKDAQIQAFFARGGRYLSERIVKSSIKRDYNHILSDKGLQRHFSTRWSIEDTLPWDFIEYPSVNKLKLWEEYQKALKGS